MLRFCYPGWPHLLSALLMLELPILSQIQQRHFLCCFISAFAREFDAILVIGSAKHQALHIRHILQHVVQGGNESSHDMLRASWALAPKNDRGAHRVAKNAAYL